jgi:hypothetical protein
VGEARWLPGRARGCVRWRAASCEVQSFSCGSAPSARDPLDGDVRGNARAGKGTVPLTVVP